MNEKQSDIVFEEPPSRAGSQYDWVAIAAKLRKKPMRWATIFERDKMSLVNAIQNGGIKALRSPAFEVRTSNNVKKNPETGEPRMCRLHMRYNPDNETDGVWR